MTETQRRSVGLLCRPERERDRARRPQQTVPGAREWELPELELEAIVRDGRVR